MRAAGYGIPHFIHAVNSNKAFVQLAVNVFPSAASAGTACVFGEWWTLVYHFKWTFRGQQIANNKRIEIHETWRIEIFASSRFSTNGGRGTADDFDASSMFIKCLRSALALAAPSVFPLPDVVNSNALSTASSLTNWRRKPSSVTVSW